ncbi:MAG: polysaccharide biosynthesis C-terminal domain-containing protein [Nocardioidaceae bacterium]
MTGVAPLERVRQLLLGGLTRSVSRNITARLLAILGLTLSTIFIARSSGSSGVGVYALLRVMPGLFGVLAVCGLPGALAFFLSPPRRDRAGMWPTILVVMVVGSAVGVLAWLALAPILAHTFFPGDSSLLIGLASVTVASQLFLTVGKTALQGLEDRRGSDTVIAAEELAFLPCFAIALAGGLNGTAAVLVGLAGADLVVGLDAWRRVSRNLGWRRGGLAREPLGWWGRPDRALARQIVSYGLRGQVGGVILLLNLRLDFAILGAIAGPAVLGSYAIASKYAELLKLPGVAITWVTYPSLAKNKPHEMARRARAMLKPAAALVAVAAVPLLFLAHPVLVVLYGREFASATGPAQILILGLVLSGASGVASGFLYGRGRPGANSLALGVGLVVTLVLDLLLIPKYGVTGAAWASTTAYLVGDAILVTMLLAMSAPARRAPSLDTLETVR